MSDPLPSFMTAIPEGDREIYRRAGYGRRAGLGSTPAVLVVDMNYNFVGVDEPIEESVGKYPQSCGEYSWRSVRATAKLLAAARAKRVPVFFSTVERRSDRLDDTGQNKQHRTGHRDRIGERGTQIVDEIAPLGSEVVIQKKGPSFFAGTPLVSLLVRQHIDTVLICGGTTSGCVRATVVDATTLGFRVAVVEECVFDRSQLSHAVNLFDMDQKYADVRTLDSVISALEDVAAAPLA